MLGCADTTSSVEQGSASTAAPVEAAASAPNASATAAQSRTNKKSASDVHVAVEKASQASETAAEASQKALQASKQAKQAANAASRAEGNAGWSKGVVTLETSPVPLPSSRSTPGGALAADDAPGATPAAHPKNTASVKSAGMATASLPMVASADDPKPVNATKLIDDVDKIEKQIDRNNLNADESQRDVLAQRLLKDAKKALADHDNVAATSLATKASILLAPLPKISSPASSSMR